MIESAVVSNRNVSRYLRPKLLRVLWAVAILTVIVGSLLSSESAPIQTLDRLPISDKVDHLAAYAALAFFPALHERRRFVLGAALGAIALGIALEFAQRMTGWRDFEIGDMIADAIGVCAGLVIGAAVRFYGKPNF
jgi:VanZ family protein